LCKILFLFPSSLSMQMRAGFLSQIKLILFSLLESGMLYYHSLIDLYFKENLNKTKWVNQSWSCDV
jgi:hypothetical protein